MNKKDLKLYTLFNCNAKKFKSFYSPQFFHLFMRLKINIPKIK